MTFSHGGAIMESRVTSIIAAGRAESGRGSQRLGPDSGSASGRTAVTKADEGVAPTPGGGHACRHPSQHGQRRRRRSHPRAGQGTALGVSGRRARRDRASAYRRTPGRVPAVCRLSAIRLRVTVRGGATASRRRRRRAARRPGSSSRPDANRPTRQAVARMAESPRPSRSTASPTVISVMRPRTCSRAWPGSSG